MLDKPDIPDEHIIACLLDAFGLQVIQFDFLPLGADRNTAVYRASAADGTAYFVKLRRGDFNEVSVIVPKLLHDKGIGQIIAPIAAQNGALWVELGEFHVMLTPFIAGKDGYETSLTDQNWIEFGQVFKGIHTSPLPPEIAARIPQETYSGQWRGIVKQFQLQVEKTTFDDPVSAALATLLKDQRETIDTLVRRAERLGAAMQKHTPQFVLCHADIHAGNLLIEADGTLHIVDWDTIIRAPKERDLMFVGGGQFLHERTPEQEESLFYQGYGQTQVNFAALAYYRYERIVQDIAAYCEEIFLTEPGGENRAQGLRYVSSNFLPGQVIDITYRTEKFLPPQLQGS